MIAYRRATVADIDILVDMRLEMQAEISGTPKDASPSVEPIRQYFAAAVTADDFRAWLAAVDAQVVASSGLVFHRRPPYGSNLAGIDAYVMNMYTRPPWRGRGIATTLMQRILDEVRAAHVRVVRLHAEEQARPVYARLGFAPNDSEMVLRL